MVASALECSLHLALQRDVDEHVQVQAQQVRVRQGDLLADQAISSMALTRL
jgi:hypothetical protein